MPESIGNLTNLQELLLRNNELSGACVEPDIHKPHESPCAGAIPASIGNLTNLKELKLYYNKLSGACVLNQTYTSSKLRSESRCAQASSRSSSSA